MAKSDADKIVNEIVNKPLSDGKFQKGNKAGKGTTSPVAKHREKLSQAFKSAITEADMIEIAKALVIKAKDGDCKAAKEVLDRVLGKAKESIEIGLGDRTLLTVLGIINGSTKGKLPADDDKDSSKAP